MTPEEWKEKILEEYKKVNDLKKNDAKWEYIQELKNLPTYQMQQFNAKFNEQKSGTNEDDIPDNCVIGLKPDGITILDREHNEIIVYKYETIMNWGISKNQLIICISTSMNEIKRVCFFTSQTKVIQALIEIYCNLLVGKTIRDIQDVVKNYDTKFEKIDTSRIKHSLMYKDEGGSAFDSEMGGDDLLGLSKEGNENKKDISENLDNSNIPPQAIPPNDD